MDFDQERRRLEKRLAQAQMRFERQEEKKRAARRSLAAIQNEKRDRAEKWHRYSLAHADREVGFEGEHALARMALRAQPVIEYVKLVGAYDSSGNLPLVQCEFAAVIANLEALTAIGRDFLIARDRAGYEKESCDWIEWQSANPGSTGWRDRKPSSSQMHLVRRIAEAFGIEQPELATRGQAHDWIEANGGNPRLKSTEGGAE